MRSLALGLPRGGELGEHHHPWPQLVYATRGVMSVDTDPGTWVVPPERAVWVPAGVEHRITTHGAVAMRTLYFRPDAARVMPERCRVVRVSPLLRELVVHVLGIGMLDERDAAHARLAGVLLDQLAVLPTAPLELALPLDRRARRVADRLRARPDSAATVNELALGSGASARTIERLFRQETGLSFGRWRRNARLHHALQRLAEGTPVTLVALEVGYESTSAFIAMFKRALGTTPRRYYAPEDA